MSVFKAMLSWRRDYWRPFKDAPVSRDLDVRLGTAEYEFAMLSRDLAKVALNGSRLQQAVVTRSRA